MTRAGHLLGLRGDERFGELRKAPQDAVDLSELRLDGRGFARSSGGGHRAALLRLGGRLFFQEILGELPHAPDDGSRLLEHGLFLVEHDLLVERLAELQLELAEEDLIAVVQNHFEHADAVHLRPVLALEIDEAAILAVDQNLRMAARDPEILDDDVAVGRAAENDPFRADRDDMLAPVLEKRQLEHGF